ncbi:MAG: radical SAM family heme chaperone HemW [Bacteroidetes bacterium]|nr:radical SAM family heme chaperone HemW [Bacteroidota bacterium]
MSGIYIHIPYCRQACNYCDFHFSTSLKKKREFIDALKKEIELQKNYFGNSSETEKTQLETIYFGGGTPSLLSKEELLELFSEFSRHFLIDKNSEITLEANPDDLTKEKLKELAQTPVNRLSIGIQSFSDEDLKFMNRIHTAAQATASVKNAQHEGFTNISIDLIYGTQTLTDKQWKKNIAQAFELDVPHISCYSLTVEPRTALDIYIRKGKIKKVKPEQSAKQFEILMNEMKKKKFVHYEISNFCKEGFYSKHNSNYWRGETYLGLGPSAHSYNGASRQWNKSSNAVYINSLKRNNIPYQIEILSHEQKYNEYVMTSLRTRWGTDLNYIEQNFGMKFIAHINKEAKKYVSEKMLTKESHFLFLTQKGKLFADKIAGDLFS